MSYEAIARRWARAVFEIGKEGGDLSRLVNDLGAFADTFSNNDELAGVLDNPLVPEGTREGILVEIASRSAFATHPAVSP